jgi:hypothetical protein
MMEEVCVNPGDVRQAIRSVLWRRQKNDIIEDVQNISARTEA